MGERDHGRHVGKKEVRRWMNVFDEHKLALAGAAMCGDLLKEAEAKLEIITNARLEWAMRHER